MQQARFLGHSPWAASAAAGALAAQGEERARETSRSSLGGSPYKDE